jgi:hypothetical protein
MEDFYCTKSELNPFAIEEARLAELAKNKKRSRGATSVPAPSVTAPVVSDNTTRS